MSVTIPTTITIDATTEQVWQVLTDFPSYGKWSNFTSIDGIAEEGTRLAIRMPGMSFRPTVTIAVTNAELQWSATILTDRLFLGQHSFTLQAAPNGTTLFTNVEAFSGALVKPFGGLFAHQNKANGYDLFNRALKSRVEELTSRPSSSTVAAAGVSDDAESRTDPAQDHH